MALIRTQPKTPALIARRLRKSAQQTSSLLKRLTKSGYLVVMDHPKDKRSKIYRIREGFFDIWLSMNESRQQRKRLPALTEFFELWYEREEREQKRRALIDRLIAGDLPAPDKQTHTATLDYLSDAGSEDEKIAAKLRLAALAQDKVHAPESDVYLDEVKALKPQGMMFTLHNMAMIALESKDVESPLKWEMQAYTIAEETGNAKGLFHIGQAIGQLLVESGQKEKGIKILRQSLAIGKKARMPGTDRIKHLLQKLEQE